eukprot:s450_g10.t1
MGMAKISDVNVVSEKSQLLALSAEMGLLAHWVMIIEVRNESDLCFQLDGEWLKAGDFKTEKTGIQAQTTTKLEIAPSTVEGVSGVAWWVDTTGHNVYISMAMTRPRLGRSFFACHAGVPPPNLKTALSSAAKLEASSQADSFTGAGPGCEWVGTEDGVLVRILAELEPFEPLSANDLSPKEGAEEPAAAPSESTEIVPEGYPTAGAKKEEGVEDGTDGLLRGIKTAGAGVAGGLVTAVAAPVQLLGCRACCRAGHMTLGLVLMAGGATGFLKGLGAGVLGGAAMVVGGVGCGVAQVGRGLMQALTWPFLEDRQQLVWTAVLEFDAACCSTGLAALVFPEAELHPSASRLGFLLLPPHCGAWHVCGSVHKQLKSTLNFQLLAGVDLFSLDGSRAILCQAGSATPQDAKRFLRTANCVCQAPQCTVWTLRACKLSTEFRNCLQKYGGQHKVFTKSRWQQLQRNAAPPLADGPVADPSLWPCQEACLQACAKGARVIEMACGTGKTRVIRELAAKHSGQVLVTVPSRVLLEQLGEEMPGFSKVGTDYNDKIDLSSSGFIAVTDSVHLLQKVRFRAIFIDESHHPLPKGFPSCDNVFKFSATQNQKSDVDFRYSLGEAIEQGVLCDYDLTVPVTTEGHPYICLANLLLSQAGRCRRVLAYCNSIAEAKLFRQVLETVGLAAWHINGHTSRKGRERVMDEFSGELQKPVHVLVTVQVLGEGVNIPNADTCMFVEPRSSYVSIIQAIGRVLRPHPSKPMAHIVLPAIAVPMACTKPGASASVLSGALGPAISVGLLHTENDNKNPVCMQAAEGHRQHALESPVPIKAAPSTIGNDKTKSKPNVLAEGPLYLRHSQLDQREMEGTVGAAHARRNTPAHHRLVASGAKPRSEGLRAEGDVALSRSSHVLPEGDPTVSRANRQISSQADIGYGYTAKLRGARPQAHVPALKAPTGSSRRDAHITDTWLNYDGKHALRNQVGAEPRASVEHAAGPEAIKAKMPQSPTASKHRYAGSFGSSKADQLERFLEVIGMADSRFADEDVKHWQCRLWVMDSRLQQRTMQKLLTHKVQNQLALILHNRDVWNLRVHAVEKFDQDHGRLPRQVSSSLEEKTLGLWLHNVGFLHKKHGISATRMQKFLDSSCDRLRARASKWLDPETPFERQTKDLKQFVLVHHRMPQNTPSSSRERKLRNSLDMLVDPSRKDSQARLQQLEGLGPVVAEWVKSRRAKGFQVDKARWNRQWDRLVEFVQANDRVPRSRPNGEQPIYYWLSLQRRQLERLPLDLGQKLVGSNPAVAAFVLGSSGPSIEEAENGSRFLDDS